MSVEANTYCLDANVLIEAWQKYYSPRICPDYWDMLNHLGREQRIFLPQMVYDEIARTEDDLAEWLKASEVPQRNIDGPVTECLKGVYSHDPIHINLVDNTKARSLADPWVIAHAINEKAIVVTKEGRVTAQNKRIKIPNVCDNMGVRCINDFQFVEELNLQFSCKFK